MSDRSDSPPNLRMSDRCDSPPNLRRSLSYSSLRQLRNSGATAKLAVNEVPEVPDHLTVFPSLPAFPSSHRKNKVLNALPKVIGRGSAKEKRRSESRGPMNSASQLDLVCGVSKLDIDVGDTVTSLAFSDDGLVLAMGSMGKRVLLHDMVDGQQLASYQAPGAVSSLAFCLPPPNTPGGILIVGTIDCQILAIDVERRGKSPLTGLVQRAPMKSLTGASVSGGGLRLALCGSEETLIVYALSASTTPEGSTAVLAQTHRLVASCVTAPLAKRTLNAVTFDAASLFVAAGGDAKLVQLWALVDIVPSSGVATLHRDDSQCALDGHSRPAAPESVCIELKARATFSTATIVHALSLTAEGDYLAVGTTEHTEVRGKSAFFQVHMRPLHATVHRTRIPVPLPPSLSALATAPSPRDDR